MENLSRRHHALFETTKRLLAELINEGLAGATVVTSKDQAVQYLRLQSNSIGDTENGKWVTVCLKPDALVEIKLDQVVSLVRPNTLQPPVVIGQDENAREELDPGTIFTFIQQWLGGLASGPILDQISEELRNSADNQEKWLEIGAEEKPLSINSPSIAWERTLIHGHPSHPFHRLCYAQEPLKPVAPEDIPDLLRPNIAFLSIPRSDIRITGPFEQVLSLLLRALDIPVTSNDRAVVPCLARQLPSIMYRFPNAVLLKIMEECAEAQASIRTLTVNSRLNFPYHLKLSLACNITSALRTITPWTTCSGPVLSELLKQFLPPNLWVFREVAAMTGSQKDFNDARHLSCILRDSMEDKAEVNNEALIIAAALAQKSPRSKHTNAQILFGLETVAQKQEWLQRYVLCLFNALLPPLARHGIGFEAHGQNLVARICRQTKELKGFVVRDFGGIRLHVPTLQSRGIDFSTLPPGGAILTEKLENVWSKVHHSLLQNHVGLLITSLELETNGGWPIVREALSEVLKPEQDTAGSKLYGYFMKDTMPFKCFLRMRMAGKYRDYVERDIPNIVHMESSDWHSVLKNCQPSIHYT